MGSAALDAYVAGIDPGVVPLVTALDGAVRAGGPDLDVAIKYRLLMYGIRADWRHWICAIDARAGRASLKFLFGVLLDDPRRVLRPGSSVLMSWDFAAGDSIDREAVAAYVREAVAKYPEYRANTAEILDRSRATARERGARRPGS